jgi:D-alanyl-D-alanine carboxypeptidase/D-alanyl-D-alanine-endopeptidase (penicillin-binding protein 4)
VRRFARRLGTRIRASDGSGLGRRNRASPKQVGKLLVEMREHRARRSFVQSLPVAGREGTVRHRMRGTAAEGRCRTKTGTLTEVSALSGYCDAGHDAIAFSILMNGVDVDRARELQDRMAALIARYTP